MKSGTGEYRTSIRRCKDLSYQIEIFAVYGDGQEIGLNSTRGPASLPSAQAIARDWMFQYELQNTFCDIEDDGDRSLFNGIKKGLGRTLSPLAKDAGLTKQAFLEKAVAEVRALS